MASKETIIQMLRRFSVVFDLRMDQDAIETWEMALEDLSDEVVQAATVHFVKHWGSQYNRKPRPGDVHEFYDEVFDTSWRKAWDEVQYLKNACQQPDSSVSFSAESVRKACASIGGLRAIYETPTAFLPKLRDQFRDSYKEIKTNLKIQGIIEHQSTPTIEFYSKDGRTIQEYSPSNPGALNIQALPEPENGNWREYEKSKQRPFSELPSRSNGDFQVIDISNLVKKMGMS